MAIKYDNCKDCHSRCIHAGKDRDFICMNGVSCKITTENPQTNADRIRAMNDKELAKFLCYFRSCDADVHPCNGCKAEQYCRAGHTGTIDWLQQPAEEG